MNDVKKNTLFVNDPAQIRGLCPADRRGRGVWGRCLFPPLKRTCANRTNAFFFLCLRRCPVVVQWWFAMIIPTLSFPDCHETRQV
jgi:hypothetical protein